MKYRMKDAEGKAIDASVEDSWRRVARDLARVEKDAALWEDRFYAALEDFKFLPAGRILAGAGHGFFNRATNPHVGPAMEELIDFFRSPGA